jgi:hypothetical protein
MASLLNIRISSKANVQLSLEDSTRQKLNGYAAFSGGTPEAVIESALEYVFSRDKEFSSFLESNPTIPEFLVPIVPRTRAANKAKQ